MAALRSWRAVTPDIKLPDSYAYLETGERENDYPMPWDKIAPARYTRDPCLHGEARRGPRP